MAVIRIFREFFIIVLLLFSDGDCHFAEEEEVVHTNEEVRTRNVDQSYKPGPTASALLSFQDRYSVSVLRRPKRKVISRGGHYIISSKASSGGASPWASSSTYPDIYSSGNSNKRTPYLGGWNVKGNLEKLPNGRLDSEGTTPYSSHTVRRINTLEIQRRERKKISKTLKAEIAQYALRNGAEKASMQYEYDVGRRLRHRVIEKFARRYSKRLSKKIRKSSSI